MPGAEIYNVLPMNAILNASPFRSDIQSLLHRWCKEQTMLHAVVILCSTVSLFSYQVHKEKADVIEFYNNL